MKKHLGIVVANSMNQTVVIERKITTYHPLYKKIITKNRRVKAHTEMALNVNDQVEYVSCRPVSKEVHFRVIGKINQ